MKLLLFFIFAFILGFELEAQDMVSLDYFLNQAEVNTPTLKENRNLLKIGELQNAIIQAQNKAFQVNVTSDVLVAPFFNSNGKAIDVTTTPSANAIGYDVSITNGGLYSAQINVMKNLFNQAITDRLLFQNKLQNNSILLTSEELKHNLTKTITDAYIVAYQLQLQESFTKDILKDLENRLQVVELMVKRAVLMESDYLLLQLDIDSKKLELQQIQNSLKVAINQLYILSSVPVRNTESLDVPTITAITNPNSLFYQKKFENDSLQLLANQNVFESRYKPQVSAYANTGLNASEIPNIYRKIGASAGIRLTIPIYDGNQRKYNAQQSLLKEESLAFYKENSKIQMKNNLESIRQQINQNEITLLLLEKQLKKQENILEIYKGKLVQGQVSIVDYLTVIQNYKLNVYTKLQMQTNRWLLLSQYNYINW
ncbi:TolC family protein [Gelidibacter sp.]|uniref:TolC family protein n=1 Tax=Gelidibacter sp. TaxID=2018083 RepID=UPI0032648BCA